MSAAIPPPFAKLFDTARGQLLVTKEIPDDRDDDVASLAMRFDGACSMTIMLHFPTEELRDRSFDQYDQVAAETGATRMANSVANFMDEAAE
jgi:hypothetical protein